MPTKRRRKRQRMWKLEVMKFYEKLTKDAKAELDFAQNAEFILSEFDRELTLEDVSWSSFLSDL